MSVKVGKGGIMAKTVVDANWSGSFPNLCSGKWTLIVNGKDVSAQIPESLRYSEMNTFGSYSNWYFDENYSEYWDDYEDGLHEAEWIEENQDWLASITVDRDVQREIFTAISNADWRHGSCGGCI